MSTELEEYLSIAKEFIEHDVPVFMSPPLPPRTGVEFKYPREWQFTKPDMSVLNDYHIYKEENGHIKAWAISAVTGYRFDVIDVDIRHGGKESLELLQEADLLPDIRWIVDTPSGGWHIYINRTGLRSLGAGKLLPGIDFKAGDFNGNGRGFVFLPGTFRRSKDYRAYKPQFEIDWEGLENGPTNTERFRRFQSLVIDRHGESWHGEITGDGEYHGPELSQGEVEEVTDAFFNCYVALHKAKPGERNDALNKIAFTVGGLISGSGLDEDLAYEKLLEAGCRIGLPKDEVKYHLDRSLTQGRLRPVNIFTESRK